MRKFWLIVLALTVLAPCALSAKEPVAAKRVGGKTDVYAYSHALNAEDTLTDGPRGRAFELTSDTMLLWVDLRPGGRFAHRTAYVFISPDGTRIEKGNWWPVLNGRPILYGKKNPVSIVSPMMVNRRNSPNPIEVFAYPEELTPQDRLTDGPHGQPFPIRTRSMLVWVDLLPQARFAHDTVYILIGANGRLSTVEGRWWPELNDKRILYGTGGMYGWKSPFKLR